MTGNGESDERTVCRDYVNNICTRGSRCRYYHPPGAGSEYGGHEDGSVSANGGTGSGSGSGQQQREFFKFCDDYASGQCFRPVCNYIHCAADAAHEFSKTGRIRPEMAQAVFARDRQRTEVGGKPLCKEFLNNVCRRGDRCKFWHIVPDHERQMRYNSNPSGQQPQRNSRLMGSSGGGRNGGSLNSDVMISSPNYASYPISYGSNSAADYEYPNEAAKRAKYVQQQELYQAYENYSSQQQQQSNAYLGSVQINSAPVSVTSGSTTVHLLRTENSDLMRTCEMLEKTVDDLRASNDSLLAENARLREHWNALRM